MCLLFSLLLISKNVSGHNAIKKDFVMFLDMIGDNGKCKILNKCLFRHELPVIIFPAYCPNCLPEAYSKTTGFTITP